MVYAIVRVCFVTIRIIPPSQNAIRLRFELLLVRLHMMREATAVFLLMVVSYS